MELQEPIGILEFQKFLNEDSALKVFVYQQTHVLWLKNWWWWCWEVLALGQILNVKDEPMTPLPPFFRQNPKSI